MFKILQRKEEIYKQLFYQVKSVKWTNYVSSTVYIVTYLKCAKNTFPTALLNGRKLTDFSCVKHMANTL